MTQSSKLASAFAALAVGLFAAQAGAGTGQDSCTAGACDSANATSVASAAGGGGADALTLEPVHILDVETAADTDTGWYGAITGGYTFPDDAEVSAGAVSVDIPLDDGFHVTGAVGTNVGVFRLEAEGGYRANDIDVTGVDGEITAITAMGNIFYDHALADAIDLYVGAGVGVGFIDFESESGGVSTDDSDTVLAYQFMVGLAVYTNDNFAITGGYRLWTASDAEIEGVDVEMPLVHTAELGVRFEF